MIRRENAESFVENVISNLNETDTYLFYLRFGQYTPLQDIEKKINRSHKYVYEYIEKISSHLRSEAQNFEDLDIPTLGNILFERSEALGKIFISKPKTNDPRWKNKEHWKSYGYAHNFYSRNPASLLNSSHEVEKSWYKKGNRKKWLKDFLFSKIHQKSDLTFNSFEDWSVFGYEHEYHIKGYPSVFRESPDPIERSWYFNGASKRWLKKFVFSKQKKRL
ncbi:hypothetical protein J4456_02960 [Candidatus Pacearchaeota archaeon]|nr:hypothetical protein [Candidatus Pacearchaeota archaeon]